MSDEIGLALRLARVACNRTQWSVARQVNVHPVQLNLIEHGKRAPHPHQARRILDALTKSAPKNQITLAVLDVARKAVGENEPAG